MNQQKNLSHYFDYWSLLWGHQSTRYSRKITIDASCGLQITLRLSGISDQKAFTYWKIEPADETLARHAVFQWLRSSSWINCDHQSSAVLEATMRYMTTAKPILRRLSDRHCAGRRLRWRAQEDVTLIFCTLLLKAAETKRYLITKLVITRARKSYWSLFHGNCRSAIR